MNSTYELRVRPGLAKIGLFMWGGPGRWWHWKSVCNYSRVGVVSTPYISAVHTVSGQWLPAIRELGRPRVREEIAGTERVCKRIGEWELEFIPEAHWPLGDNGLEFQSCWEKWETYHYFAIHEPIEAPCA